MVLASNIFPCPCCGFLVFDREAGSYDICPVCDWEDDEVQLRHPGLTGGANGRSLWQEQQRILKRFPPAVQEVEEHLRDPSWRPLEPEEAVTENVPQTGRGYFDTLGGEPPQYYWMQANDNGSPASSR